MQRNGKGQGDGFTAEYDGGTITAPTEAAARSAIADMEASKERARRRREIWGEEGHDRMVRLCHRFPSLRHVEGAGIGPWDPSAVLRWLTQKAYSHGEWLAGRFVLAVWNSTADWTAEARREGLIEPERSIRAFDVHEAWTTWDLAHREAALAWFVDPFWP